MNEKMGDDERTWPWPPPSVIDALRAALGGRSGAIAVVLGSGLGRVAEALEDPMEWPSGTIPGYPESTVPGHAGRLLFGPLAGREIWVVQGRVHLYEGYSAEETTRPVRLLHALGVRILILTNAAGSCDPAAAGPGDLVLCSDAISLFFRPLARPASPSGVWRARPPLADPALTRLAKTVARQKRIPLRTGVLVGCQGPSYETAAEAAAWRAIGGTVASMSTVPEAVAARELGMRCLLFSLVTNYATGVSKGLLSHDDVLRQADQAGGRLAGLLAALLPRL